MNIKDQAALSGLVKTIDAVYFDAVNGVAGTQYPIGTRQYPVNNGPDLRAILAARGLKKVVLLSDFTLDAPMTDLIFTSEGEPALCPTVDFNGQAITCTFINLRITDTAAAISSTHTGATTPVIMTDAAAIFVVGALIGLTINNTTDGSSGVITDNDGTTVTVDYLTGGIKNIWTTGDAYTIAGVTLSGTHTGANTPVIMTDAAATFVPDSLIGLTINNTTDGSSGVITDNDGTTVIVDYLTGGTNNIWTTGDAYTVTLAGTHTGVNTPVIMTDAAATFAVDALIGLTINNTTDGSSGVITDNDATTVTVAVLTGGIKNIWTTGDAYTITLSGTHTAIPDPFVMTDAAATFAVDALIGLTIYNTTDGSSGVITDNDATTVTCAGGLSGGSLNTWSTGDAYTVTLSGTHTGVNTPVIMTDAAATFAVDALIGLTINNTTDGSSGVITDNDGTTVTVDYLTGGTNNIWTTGDAYTVTLAGTHTGATTPVIMTDAAAIFVVGALIGLTINNTTDGSSGVITDNDGTTVTVDFLTGGTKNIWTTGDAYTIAGVTLAGTHTGATTPVIMTDAAATFVPDSLIGLTISNDTDGSSGVITDNDGTTVTVAFLTGGTKNIWTTGDAYTVIFTIAGPSEFWNCDILTVIAGAVTGANYHKCRFADGTINPDTGIINCHDCEWLGDFTNGLGTVYIYGDCHVGGDLINNDVLTIYGDCHVSGLVGNNDVLTIYGDCHVSGNLDNSNVLTIYGDCHVGGSIWTDGITTTIYGDCHVSGGLYNDYGGTIAIYGDCHVGGDIQCNRPIIGCTIQFMKPNANMNLQLTNISVIERIVSRGSLTVSQMVAGATAIIDLCGGTLTIDNSCNGGTIDLYGDCELVDNSVAPFVTVNDHRVPGHA